MRTTVEITDAQYRRLVAVAAERGVRGFSKIVQEALDAYLASLSGADLDAVLALGGSFSDDEADEMLRLIHESRARWRERPAP